MSHMYHFYTFIFYVCKNHFNSTLVRRFNVPREPSHELFLNKFYLHLLAPQAYGKYNDHSVLHNVLFIKILTENHTQF